MVDNRGVFLSNSSILYNHKFNKMHLLFSELTNQLFKCFITRITAYRQLT
jgi:hypothetical protein